MNQKTAARRVEKEHKGTIEWVIKECEKGKCPAFPKIYDRIGQDHRKEGKGFKKYYDYLAPMEKCMEDGVSPKECFFAYGKRGKK